MNIFIEEFLNLHRGQGLDIFWCDTLICPTEEESIQAARGKTGGLMRLAIKLMLAERKNKEKEFRTFVPLADLVGIIYQVYNDYVNLNSTAYIHTKGAGDDLTEGKFSLPVIHCIRTSPHYSATLLQILRQKTEDDDIKRYAIDCLQRAGSFIYTRRTLMELIERARGLLADIETGQGSGSESDIVGILDRLAANVN